MTPKEWFEAALDAKQNLKALLERRQDYLDIATNITSRPADTSLGTSGGPPSSRVADGAIRLAELAERMGDRACELQERVLQAEHVISCLPNPRHRQVLTFRYLNGYKWKDIAELMGYDDIRSAFDVNGRALAAAARYIPNK